MLARQNTSRYVHKVWPQIRVQGKPQSVANVAHAVLSLLTRIQLTKPKGPQSLLRYLQTT